MIKRTRELLKHDHSLTDFLNNRKEGRKGEGVREKVWQIGKEREEREWEIKKRESKKKNKRKRIRE